MKTRAMGNLSLVSDSNPFTRKTPRDVMHVFFLGMHRGLNANLWRRGFPRGCGRNPRR